MLSPKKLIYSQALRLKKIRIPRIPYENIFGASEAGDCTRSIYMKHMGNKPNNKFDSDIEEARVEILLGDGNYHEATIINYLKEAPKVHVTNMQEDRVLWCSECFIIGHPDAIIHDVTEDKKYVLEVKGLSTFSIGFKGKERLRDNDLDSLKDVYPTAIPQARLYRRMFDVDGAFIIVKNKDNSSLYEFFLEADPQIEARIMDKFDSIAKAIKERRVPPCDYIKTDSKCKYCPYPEECGKGRT